MTSTHFDVSGLEPVLAGVPGMVLGAVDGPGLATVAGSLRDAVRAVASAPAGGGSDGDWAATEAAGRVTIFGPDLVMTASTESATVHSLRAVVGQRSVQCDYGDPTARVDTNAEKVLAGGLAGLSDQARSAVLGRLGVTRGGMRVRVADSGQTTADWIFDEAGSGEPVAAIAERELDEASAQLVADLGTAADPEDLPPRGDAGSVATEAASGVSGVGAVVPGVTAAAAAAAAAALARRARAARSDERTAPTDDVEPDADGAPTAEVSAAEPVPTAATSTCPVCGRSVPASVRFCTGCGADLRAVAPPAEEVRPHAADTAAAPTWAPTHVVGPGGLNARPEPDPHAAVIAQLTPGVQLAVVRTWGDWAQVVADNGWTAWVDGRRLRSLS